MLAQRRSPGTIDVPAELRRLLGAARAAEGVTAPWVLDIDEVRDIEAAVGMRFGNDLLAVMAAAVPSLAERCQMRLGLILGHTGALRQAGARGDLVGVGVEPDAAMICVEKREQPAPATELVLYDPERRSTQPVALLDWLRDRVGGAGAGGVADSGAEPRLVARVPESTASGRRVRHATFGEGRVLSESGTGPTRKVKVDFPGRGLKLLQARFLEFLDQ